MSVSGFRVSSIETNFRCRFRVSGFGFRRSKPTSDMPVLGFGFRRPKPTSDVGCRFRVSGFEGRSQLQMSVSGFGFRVS